MQPESIIVEDAQGSVTIAATTTVTTTAAAVAAPAAPAAAPNDPTENRGDDRKIAAGPAHVGTMRSMPFVLSTATLQQSRQSNNNNDNKKHNIEMKDETETTSAIRTVNEIFALPPPPPPPPFQRKRSVSLDNESFSVVFSAVNKVYGEIGNDWQHQVEPLSSSSLSALPNDSRQVEPIRRSSFSAVTLRDALQKHKLHDFLSDDDDDGDDHYECNVREYGIIGNVGRLDMPSMILSDSIGSDSTFGDAASSAPITHRNKRHRTWSDQRHKPNKG